MKVARLSAFGEATDTLYMDDIDGPGIPGPGEAVLSTLAFPINPEDLLRMAGRYGTAQNTPPRALGAEGVGVVEQIGARVSHIQPGDWVFLPAGMAWAEQLRTPAAPLFALPRSADPLQLAMLRVNPATAWLMLRSFVRLDPGAWVMQNAADSAIAKCVNDLAHTMGVRTLAVAQSEAETANLRARGADVVITAWDEWARRTAEVIGEGVLSLALDAVGGEATNRLAQALGDGGTVVSYGLLSDRPCSISAHETVFRDIRLRGFWLRRALMTMPPTEIRDLYGHLGTLLTQGILNIPIEAIYDFSQLSDAIGHATRPERRGKIIVRCQE